MKLHRIYGVLLRYLFLFRHSFDRLSDAFYWPTMELLLWGITSSYLTKVTHNSHILLMIVSGILLWIIVWRAQYEISVNLLEDLWNKNLINLFVSPLKFSEWVFSFLLLGLIKGLLSMGFAMCVAYLLYRTSILLYGFYFVPFIFLLLMTGWWVGFLVAGIIIRYGTKLQMLAWSVVAILSPFSGIYYPISVLPHWAQTVAAFVPTSYIFEGSRKLIAGGTLDPKQLLLCFLLNCVYITLGIIFMRASFNKVLEKGLVNLT